MNRYLILLSLMFFTAFTTISCKNDRNINSATKVISPQEVYNAMQADKELQIIDVRTAEEYSADHLKTAQNICVTDDDFESRAVKLDKNKPVYVYCKKGGRSARASLILEDMGFTQIYDLQGGITNWRDADLETVK